MGVENLTWITLECRMTGAIADGRGEDILPFGDTKRQSPVWWLSGKRLRGRVGHILRSVVESEAGG